MNDYEDNCDHAARCGNITASRFKDVLSKGRGSAPSKTRESYVIELAVERLTGLPKAGFSSAACDWGNENEPHAIASYEALTGNMVREAGYVVHPDISTVGASPDGLVVNEELIGNVEVKCPYNSVYHINTFRFGMPKDHTAQVQGQMMCSGAQWNDFVSFDPRMPEHLQIYIQRIERDEKYIDTLFEQCVKMEDEIQAFIAQLPKAA